MTASSALKAENPATATSALYFLSEGFDTTGAKLMGRHVAGEEFLRGFSRYSTSNDLYCFTNTKPMFDDFCRRVAGFLEPENGQVFPKRHPHWIPFTDPGQIEKAGCVFLPGPGLGEYAWHRRRVGAKKYSLCGVTHTTASDRAIGAINDFLIAPIQKWDALICTSSVVRTTVNYLLESYGDYLSYRLNAPKQKPLLQLPVIPLGVNTLQFAPADAQDCRKRWREELGIGEDDVVALFVGRLSAHAKAHPFPMYAGMEQAAQKTNKKLHLIQAGWFANTGIEDSFRQGAKDVAPSVNAIFLDGRKPDIRREIWFAADIFCSLSDNIQETFGITPIEAMAAGLPQIVSDWDGYKDTVRDGIDGFRIPTLSSPIGSGRDLALRYDMKVDTYDHYCAGSCQSVSVDIAETAKAFLKLIEDPELRHKMGEAGRERARSVYDWRVVIGQYEELWTELAAIRAAEDELWQVRSPIEAENPLYDDPFATFASYPTRALMPDDVITLLPGTTPERAIEMRRMNLNNFGYLTMPDILMKVIERIANQGGAASVKEIVGWIHSSQRITTIRTLVWFAKVGLVSINEHNRG